MNSIFLTWHSVPCLVIQNFYVNQKMPRIPGELVAKRTSPPKKKAQIQRTQICSLPPPIATNMEVNLRIVTLVNVELKTCSTVNGGGVKDRALANMALPTSYFK